MITSVIRHIIHGTFFTHVKELTVDTWYANAEKNVFKKQKRMLDNILHYAVNYCPHYKSLKGKKHLQLNDFPIVSKLDISVDYDSFVSIKKKHYTYSTAYTGGSTGEPFKLYTTYTPRILENKRWIHYGYEKGDIVLAMDGTKLPEKNIKEKKYLYKKGHKDIPFGSYGLSSLYLTDASAQQYCENINKLKPSFIRGYPSFVYSIACYAESLGISMGEYIKGIELTSETAFDYQIEKIRNIFCKRTGSKIFLQYGHTEGCVCAYTIDESFRYRVEPLYGYVEIVDDHGQHVSEGQTGEVVVTTLRNKVMPLIRYRTGDYAEYGGHDDKYVYLNKIHGRTQDYIVDNDGNKVLLTALIFGQHFKALGHISKWQIEQSEKGIVKVRIQRGHEWTKEDEKEISELFSETGHVKCVFIYDEEIPLTPRGKSKMLIQHLKI